MATVAIKRWCYKRIPLVPKPFHIFCTGTKAQMTVKAYICHRMERLSLAELGHISAILKDVVIGRFASPYENRICLCLDEISPEEMRVYQLPLMDLITSELGGFEKKGVSSRYMVKNLLRIFWSTNDGARFMKLAAKDRKYAFFEGSDAKVGQIQEYFAPLMAVFNRGGVRRAFYDHLMAIDISGFNFQTQRCQVQMYKDAKLLNVKRELHLLRHHVMQTDLIERVRAAANQKPPRKVYVKTGELFKQFSEWITSPLSGVGRCASYSSTPIAFGILLKGVPGFIKNPSHGCAASHSIDAPALVHFLQDSDLLTPTEVQWLLNCTDGTNYEAYCNKLEQQATAEANAKIQADEMAFTKQDTTYDTEVGSSKPLRYAEDAIVHDISSKRQAEKQQEKEVCKKTKIV
eukprot:20895-Heterococcus_DN1.PRE.7